MASKKKNYTEDAMPIFEFVCTTCQGNFDELLRNVDAIADVACPKCGSSQVKRKLSTFASKVAGSVSQGGSASSSCGPSGST